MHNGVNCWKPNAQAKAISSQADQDRDRKVQRLGGSDRYPSNTPLAPRNPSRVGDIVRSCVKAQELDRNDLAVKR